MLAVGTQYMRYLMDKMDNNPYTSDRIIHAGLARVQGWLPEKKLALPLESVD